MIKVNSSGTVLLVTVQVKVIMVRGVLGIVKAAGICAIVFKLDLMDVLSDARKERALE